MTKITYKPLDTVRFLIVHCSATPAHLDIGADEIRIWHRRRGWLDIGYHFVIRRNGAIENGRPLDRPGAHAIPYNQISLGICLVGGAERSGKSNIPDIATDNFTVQQRRSLHALLVKLQQKFPDARVIGHRDVPNTNKECPSFDVKAWWAANQPPLELS